ncbi:hypothetical protein [Helicobacter rodentium]|nr:hypothetical protein [Helicobacter rodentium]
MTKRGLSSMQSMQDYRFTNVDMCCANNSPKLHNFQSMTYCYLVIIRE